ncbi:MAG TPA: flagellar export chaperone FlgN [Phycisphaerae bacterium]|nr:flagellar export chaperone FlgN [Phycisphaerae bacterium]
MNASALVEDGRRLTELLTRQRDLYRELYALAHRQESLVASNDTDGLLRLLSSRQRLVDRLMDLDGSLAPIRAQSGQILATMSPQQQDEVRALVGQVNELLKTILKRDESDTESLSLRRNQIKQELHQAAAGQQAHRAYASKSDEPRYLDQTDE